MRRTPAAVDPDSYRDCRRSALEDRLHDFHESNKEQL
jgi:hypothetical protein